MGLLMSIHTKSSCWINPWFGNSAPLCVPSTSTPWSHFQKWHVVDLGILEEYSASKWTLPCFIVAKKWLYQTNLCLCIQWRKLPLTIIYNLLQCIKGYSFFMKLNIFMQHYYCHPIWELQFKHLPMGLKWALEFTQKVLKQVLCGLNNIGVHLDDNGAFSIIHNLETYVHILDEILSHLEVNGFIVTPLQCEWLAWYWLTPTGLKSWKNHISAKTTLNSPRNIQFPWCS